MQVERHGDEDITSAIKTYRYLRLGMFIAVVVLFAAILIEYRDNGYDCIQSSISAYYWTPVRVIFVAGLFVISFGLITIKGRGVEDIALNFAGILAPLVAVIPTTDVGDCWRTEPDPYPLVDADPGPDEVLILAPWVRDNIENNMWALVAGGVLALGITGVVILFEWRHQRPEIVRVTGTDLLTYAATALGVVAITYWLSTRWESFLSSAHTPAAIWMFVFLGIAIAATAYHDWNRQKNYAIAYAAIAFAMAATGAVLKGFFENWDDMVFWLEASEISYFAVFWLIQTGQHWNDFGPDGPAPAGLGSSEAQAGSDDLGDAGNRGV